MTDTPREAILAELLRVASKDCTGPHPTLACFHNMTPRHLWCNPCRCQEAANVITRQTAECDNLRAQLAEQKAATFTSERFRREDGMSHITDLGDMYTRAKAAEAQLAAREGEIATLTARASKLEDAAFHFQTCRTCRKVGDDECLDGRQFAAYLRGEESA